jgi:hypothetical protein
MDISPDNPHPPSRINILGPQALLTQKVSELIQSWPPEILQLPAIIAMRDSSNNLGTPQSKVLRTINLLRANDNADPLVTTAHQALETVLVETGLRPRLEDFSITLEKCLMLANPIEEAAKNPQQNEAKGNPLRRSRDLESLQAQVAFIQQSPKYLAREQKQQQQRDAAYLTLPPEVKGVLEMEKRVHILEEMLAKFKQEQGDKPPGAEDPAAAGWQAELASLREIQQTPSYQQKIEMSRELYQRAYVREMGKDYPTKSTSN